MTPFAAPDAETLRKFALGDLPQDEWDRVARHLEAHPPRSETIAELGTDDTFVSALRAVPPGAADDPPELRSIIAAAAKLVGADETGEHESGTGSLPFVAASEAEIVLPPNGRLGRFRIVRELGRGGMGAVFAAVDEQLGRDVALKVMLPRLAANPVARERFLREARTAALVEHDNIVPILEVGEDGGIPFIAMPLLRGESLDDRLKAGALPVAEAVRIARDMVEGLAAAHAHGLIHRDIKPSNVWLETNPDGRLRRVRILDFGLARRVSESDRVTLSGTILGTPAFMAPEQARAAADVDARADLFSLGGVLYRMTTGRNPFHGTDTYSLLSALATDTPKAPTELNADVPRAMNDLILKLLQKDPAARPQSAAAVLTALDAIPTATVTPAPRRSRALPIATLALSLIGLVGILFGSTIVRIATNKGELVVEVVDNPNVEIVVKQDGAVVVDKTKDRRFVLTAKDGEIEFLDPETGATAQTKTFRLTRGGVDRVSASIGEKKTGIEPKASGDTDRRAAEFVLRAGGKVRVNGETLDIADPKDLPTKAFELTACNLSYREKLDEAGLAVFAGCKNLKELDFRATKVTAAGLAHFANTANLEILRLDYTGIGDDGAAHFKNCPKLKVLGLTTTAVTAAGLAHFAPCNELTELALEGPAIDDAAAVHFRNCRKITKLFLSHASMTDAGLAHFANCVGLTTLNLNHAPAIGDEGLLRLKAGQLTEVHLSGTRVTDRSLASFEGSRALHTLHLADAKVTDAGLAKLKNCPLLATLDLSKLPITDGGLAQLAGMKFAALNLGYSKITDAGLAHLKASTGLIQLELPGTAVSDKGMSALRDLKALKVLELSGCAGVAGATLKDLDLRELESLSVARTGFTDAGLTSLAKSPNLRMLHCEGSKVTRAGTNKLHDALPKCRIVWDGGTIEPK